MPKPSNLRFITLTVIATVVSVLFIFMGAPFLRVLRNVFGAVKYWGAGLIVCAGFWSFGLQPLGLLLFSIWTTIGFYGELEERGRSGFWLAAASTSLGSVALIAGSILWSKTMGLDMTQILQQGIDAMMQQIATKSGNSSIKLDSAVLIQQVPSAVVLLLMTSLGFALMLDRRTGLLMGVKFEKIATHMRLLEFKNPDFLIWATMVSFLLSFVKLEPPMVGIVATNAFNIMMGLYFFQGLAVLEVTLLSFRVGNFLRFLVYFIVVGQLFFLLSAVGVIDYWVDFRARLKRMRPHENDQKNGEHV
jgi:hypothetical protein